MKTITIGRSAECDITIEHELISRKHAIIRLYSTGKMEIVDMGRNGTSVNGAKLQPNFPKRIKRNDVITFAGAKSLDWSLVPENHTAWIYAAIAALAVVLLCAVAWGISCLVGGDSQTVSDDEYSGPISGNSSQGGSEQVIEDEEETMFHWPSFLTGEKKKPSRARKAPKQNDAAPQQTETKPSAPSAPAEQPKPDPEKPAKQPKKGPKIIM